MIVPSSPHSPKLASWITRGNSIFSYSYSSGQNVGEVRQFPELDAYQQHAFAYLKKRASEAKNPLLAARYNHLLWKAPKGVKSKTHAEGAVKAYLVVCLHPISPHGLIFLM